MSCLNPPLQRTEESSLTGILAESLRLANEEIARLRQINDDLITENKALVARHEQSVCPNFRMPKFSYTQIFRVPKKCHRFS